MQHNSRQGIIRSVRSRQYGAVLVEMAVAFVILLTMLFGIIQYCVILSSLNTMQQVVGEGAKFYTRHFNDPNDTAETKAYMQTVAQGTFLSNSDISNGTSVTTVGGGVMQANSLAQISLSYDMSKRTYFGGFVPGVRSGTNIVTKSTTVMVE